MRRSRLATAGVTVLLAVGFVGASGIAPAGAKKVPPFTATGHVSCTGFGKVKGIAYGPPGGFHVSIAAKVSVGCTGTTGNPAVLPVGAKVYATYSDGGACSLTGVGSGWQLSIGWKAKGAKITPSSVSFSNSEGSSTGWRVPSSIAPVGTAHVAGSYASDGRANGRVTMSPDQFSSQCGNTGRPPKIVTSMGLSFNL